MDSLRAKVWRWARAVLTKPEAITTIAVAVVLGPLLATFEPIGGDPDHLYRPIKAELARALRSGALPFWSDRIGVGVPLLAESHAAALYPPNWFAYGLFDVAAAFRGMMFLHLAATVATTALYARQRGLTPTGAALAGLVLALGGFAASHAAHEPFHHALPYLPLVLFFAERFADSGRAGHLAGLALSWAAQLALGHYQVPMWTGVLALFLGAERVLLGGRPLLRVMGLAGGLVWAIGMAAVPLAASAELVRTTGFDRPRGLLARYAVPPEHWPQLAWPWLFQGRRDRDGAQAVAAYWGPLESSEAEATVYVGTLPLLLAGIGSLAGRRHGRLGVWPALTVLSFLLAVLPRLWPEAFLALLNVPGLNLFRAPGRHTLITTLGLALLAGRGLDLTIRKPRFLAGTVLVLAFAVMGLATTLQTWSMNSAFRDYLGPDSLLIRIAISALGWAVSLVLLVSWRRQRIGPGLVLGVVALDLGVLFYRAPVNWGWSVAFPGTSPTFARLAQESDVGLVSSPLGNLPVRGGWATANPMLGIAPPSPNFVLGGARDSLLTSGMYFGLFERLGVTHEVRDEPIGPDALIEGPDPALDRLGTRPPGTTWCLVRAADTFPAAWVALKAAEKEDWATLISFASFTKDASETWYLPADRPPERRSPPATFGRVVSWDGRVAVVDHDGSCDLIVRRAHYPGWMARVNDGPERPAAKIDLNLQGARLEGAGRSQVVFRYRPTYLPIAAPLAITSLLAALGVLALKARRAGRTERPGKTPD